MVDANTVKWTMTIDTEGVHEAVDDDIAALMKRIKPVPISTSRTPVTKETSESRALEEHVLPVAWKDASRSRHRHRHQEMNHEQISGFSRALSRDPHAVVVRRAVAGARPGRPRRARRPGRRGTPGRPGAEPAGSAEIGFFGSYRVAADKMDLSKLPIIGAWRINFNRSDPALKLRIASRIPAR